MNREQLIYYSLKSNGEASGIAVMIKKNEPFHPIPLPTKVTTILDDDYPKQFRDLRFPPLVLYYIGELELLNHKSIGIVGSRIACPYSISVTKEITGIVKKRYVIVSGMAKGIDSVAHFEALKGGKTVAILGSGIQYVYPAENLSLYREITRNGLVISEYPGSTPPLKHHFPYRNRMIAASSQGIIVTKAGMKSGTMLTVKEALELGRDVYCVPYPYGQIDGLGCNSLIQQGAYILTNEQDLDII